MQAFSIASNDTTVFIHLDKTAITATTLAEITNYLSRFLVDDIEYVSDEEQRDIEATLAALSEEDKKPVRRFEQVAL